MEKQVYRAKTSRTARAARPGALLVLFLALLFGFALIDLFWPKRTMSELENRRLASLPALTVDAAVQKHLFNGCPTSHYPAADGRWRVYDTSGRFLGLANVQNGCLNVEKIFCERG